MLRYVEAGSVLLGQLWQDGAVWVMFRQVRARLLRLVGLSFGALRLVLAVGVRLVLVCSVELR